MTKWSEEQIKELNDFQRKGEFHPYTCPGDNDCSDRILIATENGWVCSCGEYTQDWAHSFHFEDGGKE